MTAFDNWYIEIPVYQNTGISMNTSIGLLLIQLLVFITQFVNGLTDTP